MKIRTDTVSFELSISEFETILQKDMLDIMVETVASLSEYVTDELYISGAKEMLEFIERADQGMDFKYDDTDFSYEDDDNICDSEESNNEIVDRLYQTLFRNGDIYRG